MYNINNQNEYSELFFEAQFKLSSISSQSVSNEI